MARLGRATTPTISTDDVLTARPSIVSQLCESVLAPLSRQLSVEDRRFPAAMAIDEGPTSVGEIANRLARSPAQINNYRVRLLDAGAIRQSGRGMLEFAIPGLRALTRQTAGPGDHVLGDETEVSTLDTD